MIRDLPVSTERIVAQAEKDAAKRGIQIHRDGRWSYFPGVKKPADLTSTDIENFLVKWYSRRELALLLATLDQERALTKQYESFRRRTGSEATMNHGAIPAKLDMALQHDFPDEFGMAMNRKSVRHLLKVIERCVPAMLTNRFPKAVSGCGGTHAG